MFWQLEPEQIIEALVAAGYGRKMAEKEVEQFLAYKEKVSSPQTWEWEGEETATPQEGEEPPSQSFGRHVARVKGEA